MHSDLSNHSSAPQLPADAAAAESTTAAAKAAAPPTPLPSNLSPGLRRAIQLANNGDCQTALQLLKPQGRAPETTNAIGVCLMRLGSIQEAVHLYQGMVLKPGCTWTRPEVPTLYKVNYATALLLKGTPAGCLGVLNEINEPDNPSIQQLCAALKKWEAGLSFWRRWDWRLTHVEPPHCRIELDFPPGQFFSSSEQSV